MVPHAAPAPSTASPSCTQTWHRPRVSPAQTQPRTELAVLQQMSPGYSCAQRRNFAVTSRRKKKKKVFHCALLQQQCPRLHTSTAGPCAVLWGSCAPVQMEAACPLRLKFEVLLAENLAGKIRSPPETPPHLQPLLPQRVIFTSPAPCRAYLWCPRCGRPGRRGRAGRVIPATRQLLDQLPAAAAARVSMANCPGTVTQ